MKHLSWKYVAGLFDGEGCFDFQVVKRNHEGTKEARYWNIAPRMRISMAEGAASVLELLKNQCGGSVHYSDANQQKNANWSPTAAWEFQGSRIRAVIVYMLPSLIIKREQAKFLIWYIDNFLGKRHDSYREGTIAAARKIAYEEMKLLKRDPQRLSERAVERVEQALTDAIVQPELA